MQPHILSSWSSWSIVKKEVFEMFWTPNRNYYGPGKHRCVWMQHRDFTGMSAYWNCQWYWLLKVERQISWKTFSEFKELNAKKIICAHQTDYRQPEREWFLSTFLFCGRRIADLSRAHSHLDPFKVSAKLSVTETRVWDSRQELLVLCESSWNNCVLMVLRRNSCFLKEALWSWEYWASYYEP